MATACEARAVLGKKPVSNIENLFDQRPPSQLDDPAVPGRLVEAAKHLDTSDPTAIRFATMNLRHQRLVRFAVPVFVKRWCCNINELNLMIPIPFSYPVDFASAQWTLSIEEHLEFFIEGHGERFVV